SSRPSAQRCWIATLRPSTNPASLSPRRNAATMFSRDADGVLRRNPTTGIDGCCPRAPSGHAAALPSRAMNSRRLIRLPPILRTTFSTSIVVHHSKIGSPHFRIGSPQWHLLVLRSGAPWRDLLLNAL